MNRFSLIIICLLFTVSLSAKKKDPAIVTLGSQAVTKSEFIANYQKNNTNIIDENDRKTPAEYLDLYVNFKLKVLEAQALGYDTMRSFTEELKGYRKELSRPYMTDVSYNEEMVKTAYYRTKFERKASHILVLVKPEASPADTLAAWNKISDLRIQIVNGADFNDIAQANSEDPSAKENKGLLGYFGAFQMVYPFEDMTYKTPVGQISPVLKTRFGYHLIKVHDERPSSGEIKVAHIMKMFAQDASEEAIAALKLSADSIKLKLNDGADFAELAKTLSDDKQSGMQGGELNWFTMTSMIPTFAEAAFALKTDGEISPVIRTPYGWHIIKRLEYRSTPEFDKIRAELETKIKQNPEISTYSDESFDRKLRIEYQLKTDQNNFQKLLTATADSTIRKDWPNSVSSQKDNILISFAKKTFNTGDFIQYLKDQQVSVESIQTEPILKTQLNKFINSKLLEYEDTQLEGKHPDFARVYKEYHDGILLFNISKDKIWDVASSDSARLQKFYDESPKKYFWTERYKGLVIKAKDSETRTKIEAMLDGREMTKKEISEIFNTTEENAVEITEVAVEKGENPLIDFIVWNGEKPADYDEATTIVNGKIVKNEQKTLKDAWGIYSSDFQEQIEKEWIDSLKLKYPVKINEKELQKIKTVE